MSYFLSLTGIDHIDFEEFLYRKDRFGDFDAEAPYSLLASSSLTSSYQPDFFNAGLDFSVSPMMAALVAGASEDPAPFIATKAASVGALVINEILADPSASLLGDANGDSVSDADDDQFVEIVNTGAEALDISGLTLRDTFSIRHVFSAGTVLEAGQAIVVFGGGAPSGSFGGALVQVASSGSLGLNTNGDNVSIRDGNEVIVSTTYGSIAGGDQSITRSPDLTGSFVQHATVAGAGNSVFSPGTQLDGSAFEAPEVEEPDDPDDPGDDPDDPGDDPDNPDEPGPDVAGPVLVSSQPADDATDVDPTSNISLTFDEPVFAATGNITLRLSSDDSIVEILSITGSQVTIEGAVLTIDPIDLLASGTDYYIQIDTGAVEDEAGNPFAGILDAATLNFATPAPTFDLRVTEVFSGQSGPDLTNDWFEITNFGTGSWTAFVDPALFYDDESASFIAADFIADIGSIAPGESVIVVIGDADDAADWITAYGSDIDLSSVKVGFTNGDALSQSGDAVNLFVGNPVAGGSIVDTAIVPDGTSNDGQSFDVLLNAFSTVDNASGAFTEDGIGGPITDSAVIASPGLTQQGLTSGITLSAPDVIRISENGFIPGAESDTFSIVLDGAPSSPVIITITPDDGIDVGGGAGVPLDITFTPDNFAVPQLISVTAPDDAEIEPFAEELAISLSVFSNDAFYTNATLDALTVIVADDDAAATAPVGQNVLMASILDTVTLDAGAEIVAFDRASARAFVTSGDGLQILDVSDPGDISLVGIIDPTSLGFDAAGFTSVAVNQNGLVAAALPADTATDEGNVLFFEAATGLFVGAVTVGALPDALTFTPDGMQLLVANEGEPDDNETQFSTPDPRGSISIITIDTENLSASVVNTLDFTGFDAEQMALELEGLRIFPDETLSDDVEPEFIAVSPDGTTAFVTLQEANGVAIIDIATQTITSLQPLGTVDFSDPGFGLDPSNRDGGINIANHPVFGLRQPDTISSYAVGGTTYFVTANEGDSRDFDVSRIGDLVLDLTAFPDADALQADDILGRLEVSNIDGDLDGDGDFDRLFTFGTRSFSIFDDAGTLIFDSGSLFEVITAAEVPFLFNSDESDQDEFDSRSDDSGPEPEGITIGEVNGNIYAFIGLERTGGILVFDITDPTAPVYDQYIFVDGDAGPEGLTFVSGQNSPTGAALLLVANEDSSTLSVIELGFDPGPDLVAPTLMSTSPADDALMVPVDGQITLTFDEAIIAGSGVISIFEANSSVLFAEFSISDDVVSIIDDTIFLPLPAELSEATEYVVLADAGVVTDLAGNPFAGIADPAIFNFTTIDTVTVIDMPNEDGIFQGTDGRDQILGSDNGDTIFAAAGNDTVTAGLGNDTLHGEDGDDNLSGGISFDSLFGGAGNDELDGGNNADNLFAGIGNDTLIGGQGFDRLFGELGNDQLFGGLNDDALFGGAGFDTLNGGSGNDRLFGNFNWDIFQFDDGFGQDVIFDFDVANQFERIDLSGVSAITSFQDLVDQHLGEDSNGNALITDGNDSITLIGVDYTTLTEGEFIF